MVGNFTHFISTGALRMGNRAVATSRVLVTANNHPDRPSVPNIRCNVSSSNFFTLPTLPRHITIINTNCVTIRLTNIVGNLNTGARLFIHGRTPLHDFSPVVSRALIRIVGTRNPRLRAGTVPGTMIGGTSNDLALRLRSNHDRAISYLV